MKTTELPVDGSEVEGIEKLRSCDGCGSARLNLDPLAATRAGGGNRTSLWSCMSRLSFSDTKWIVAVLLLVVLFLEGPIGPRAYAESAASFFKKAQSAEDRDDIDAAYDLYTKAFQKSPKDLRYKTAYERSRFSAAAMHTKRGERLRDQGDNTGALTEFLHALEIDPGYELAQQDVDAARRTMGTPQERQETSVGPVAMSEMGEMSSPVRLRPISNEPITVHSVEDSKIIYQTVGKLAGINVLFDPDYNGKRVQVDLSNVSLFDALHIIGTISGTFWRPITSNTIFVAQNTRAKRTELDEQAVQTFYLSNSAQQNDLNDIQTALRNVLTNAKLYGVPSQNAIVMRATPDELLLAQKLVNDLDKARPEVVVDVAVLEVNRNKMTQIGIQLPQTASVTITTPTTATSSTNTTTDTTGTTTTNNLTLNNLAHLNANDFAVTLGTAQANLLLSDSDTKVLQNPRIRATDGQQATLKIGSRIPIATGSFSNGVGGSALGGIGAVQTQFQYIDVGVNIDMKPTIHYDRDVTLKLKIEISSESGQTTISGVTEPIISQRTVDQVIRLREGEVNMIGGLLDKEENKAVSGWPGLGELPILKYMFSTITKSKIDDEIVFLLIPHVVRGAQLSPLNLEQIDTGTGSAVEIRRKPRTDDGVAPVVTPAPTASNSSPAGVTGPVAAASALAAMHQEAETNTGAPVALQLTTPPTPPKVGSSFQVAVNLNGGHDIFSVPLQVQYDQTKLTLINVDSGNFLGADGQAVALVHRDDGNGGVAISASRPPGVAGVNGSGPVCLMTFQAKAPGDAPIAITRPGAKNSAQQALPVTGSQITVHVQ
ncbi:Type IV pilus biogenesis protein PilQ [Acidisarcina polymorpha]|uniref:Type IV pilus biogenesis protein PilQ n=1 Tax=Acidisarcina polymorpha TaxID=2211140 RepID=A0A2Z5G6E3_9BACT|nr:cohesin domain-containing protein [Acidisarcina polymorpha]AXC14671.1 Type IV pilus biogenesis protein PilQ [Acidisarcina polymorpha]